MINPLRRTLPSPCRQICQLDAQDVCIGCARTRHEIGQWSQASVERQAEILQAAAQRALARPAHAVVNRPETRG